MKVSIYLPEDLADDVKKYEITMSAVAQDALRAAVALKKALEVPVETPSLKELLNIQNAEGTMSLIATVEQPFVAVTVAEGIQDAVKTVRKSFGPEVKLMPRLIPTSIRPSGSRTEGAVAVLVYLL